MRFVHVASYKDEFFNGIKSVLLDLIPEQRKLGHEVHVINQEKNDKQVIPGEQYVSSKEEFVNAIQRINPDFVIFHSLYGISDVKYSWYLNKNNIPYLVEPHGGTSIENSKKNWLKKKIANLLYANQFIAKASGLIYLNKKEADDCVFKGIRKKYAIVQNGTTIPQKIKKECSNDIVRFIFLARIDIFQKGLDLLFPAIEKFNENGYKNKVEFHFYGKARTPKWALEFDRYIAKANENVFFHGPALGVTKEKAYRNADVFILTSRYEGMPMAVLEAMSYGIPCIVTPQTNMGELIAENHAGWITKLDIDSIVTTLYQAYTEYKENRDVYIENAIEAVKPYSWESIAKKSVNEYMLLINK